MHSLFAARLLGLATAGFLCACGSTEPRALLGLNGNFGSTAGGAWLGLTLHESGGNVTGNGWRSAGQLKRGGTITGSYQAPDLEFDMVSRQGGETWHFNGTFERDTLRGDFNQVPFIGSIVELARVDTVPTGEYTLHLTGAITADFPGDPVFGYLPLPGEFALILESPGPPIYHIPFYWTRTSPPPPGVYPLSFGAGASPRAGVYRYGAGGPGFIEFPPQSGTLTLEVSTRRALIGEFVFTVKDPTTGETVMARGRFNAGCVGATC